MDFPAALTGVLDGRRAARAGWHGKNMFIYASQGSIDDPKMDKEHVGGVPRCFFDDGAKGTTTRMPTLNLSLPDGSYVPGWLASQTDMFAEDWELL